MQSAKRRFLFIIKDFFKFRFCNIQESNNIKWYDIVDHADLQLPLPHKVVLILFLPDINMLDIVFARVALVNFKFVDAANKWKQFWETIIPWIKIRFFL